MVSIPQILLGVFIHEYFVSNNPLRPVRFSQSTERFCEFHCNDLPDNSELLYLAHLFPMHSKVVNRKVF